MGVSDRHGQETSITAHISGGAESYRGERIRRGGTRQQRWRLQRPLKEVWKDLTGKVTAFKGLSRVFQGSEIL